MIVLRTPKGWTGPKEVDGKKTEGFWRSHQVPLAEHRREARSICSMLEDWMQELPAGGAVRRRRQARCRTWRRSRPQGERRMGANPHANGGLLLQDLELPDFRDYAVDVPAPGRGRRPKRRA